MTERQVIVTWYTPEEKMPPEDLFVVVTFSGRANDVMVGLFQKSVVANTAGCVGSVLNRSTPLPSISYWRLVPQFVQAKAVLAAPISRAASRSFL